MIYRRYQRGKCRTMEISEAQQSVVAYGIFQLGTFQFNSVWSLIILYPELSFLLRYTTQQERQLWIENGSLISYCNSCIIQFSRVWSLISFFNHCISQFGSVWSFISFKNHGMFQFSKVRYLISFCSRGIFQFCREWLLM